MRNLVKNLRVWILVAAVFAGADSSFAQKYSVVDLGAFTNSLSTVNAINNSGQFAGVLNINGGYRAVLYGGSWTNLGTLGGSSSFALGMNDALRVVGRSRLTNGTVNRAFLWTPGGTNGIASNPQMKDLGTLGGAAAGAEDINTSAQITGYAQTGSDDHAFRYSGGTMTDIGNLLPNNHNSYASGINDAGHIVGTDYDNSFNTATAFRYNGSTVSVLAFSGWNNTYGLAINNNDHIAGYVSGSSADHAFRYSTNFFDLGTLGGSFSYAFSINNSNIIVGGSYTDANNLLYHAFICTNSSLVDLNNQLDDSGAGWVLNEARAINDSGQIAGIGMLNGEKHAFLLAKLPPGITHQPSSQTIALSNSVTFTVGATGTAPLNYQWRFNGTNLAGATTNFYTLNNAQPSNAGNYTVIVTNNYGAVTSAIATLIFGIPPSITNQPVSQSVVVSNNVTFTAGATGTTPLNYQWQFNGNSIAGATTNFYSITNAQSADAGNYTLVVTNNYGALTSAVVVLMVNFRPSITNQPASQSVVAGNSAMFTVGAMGTPPLNYQWRFNGTNLAGATTNSYTVLNAQTNHAGNYTVVVMNNYGAVTSTVATLTVTVLVPPRITDIKILGTNLLLSFTTINGGTYFVEGRSNLVTGVWSDLISNIAGNGSVNTATNFGGTTLPERYYRVRLSSP